MTVTATARRVGDTLRHEVDVNGRHAIVTDEPERLGGTDAGPAPHELLAAMLAACVSTTLVTYARNRGWGIGELSVHVEYDTETTPRAVSVEVLLPDGLTTEQVRRLERVAAACPARRSLEAAFAFEERLLAAHV
jgi:putative redox protein